MPRLDMPGYFALEPRPLSADDHVGARVLLMGALGVTPYVDRAMEVLQRAERGGEAGLDAEHRALVIERDGTVAALALFGSVSGTVGVVKLHAALLAPGVSADDVGARLIDAVIAAAKAEGARMIVAELPDDPAVGAERSLLQRAGFGIEAFVADFFRDGVALTLLRRAL